ncbi:MAG: CrcB family protein [Aldersonia sp.]|nr:CrcB family protein [Aldersonia sp.]
MTALLVQFGAMLGAPARYLTDRAVQRRNRTVFPLGTLTVNVVGSAILGALTGAAVGHEQLALWGIGFCGALTTYSAFGYETVRLTEDGAYRYALANVVLSVAASLTAAFAGFAVTQALLA